jgi:cold shock CspA family protein
MTEATETGTVKFFSHKDGYGMIVPADGGPDVFFHANQCRFPANWLENQSETVLFQREEGPAEGGRATAVWLVKKPGVCPCCGLKMRAA